MKRAKLIALGAFIGLILLWLGIMIAAGLADDSGQPALERVLKK